MTAQNINVLIDWNWCKSSCLKRLRVDKYLTEVDVMYNCWISATDAALFSTKVPRISAFSNLPDNAWHVNACLKWHKKGTRGHWQEDFSKEENVSAKIRQIRL